VGRVVGVILEPDGRGMARAVEALKSGCPVGVPTETVYGLAALSRDEAGIARVFAIKNRPYFDPLIVHVAEPGAVDQVVLAEEMPDAARLLTEAFWPGPLTLVMKKRPEVSDLATSGLPTVAVRCPAHPVARRVIEAVGQPLVAPSANRFGRISPTTAQAVEEELGRDVDVILEGGPCERGIESTIIDCSGERLVELRPGAVSRDLIETVVGPLAEGCEEEAPRAPGMLPSHYAPQTALELVERGELGDGLSRPGGTAILFWSQPSRVPDLPFRVLSPSGDPEEAAANLFRMMRELDGMGVERIVAERPPEAGLGRAIGNRLERAATPA